MVKEIVDTSKKLVDLGNYSYFYYANLAVCSEKALDWADAAEYWLVASHQANRNKNRKWAHNRCEFCLIQDANYRNALRVL